ncbi:hypothetical protein BDZ89DRAFT_1085814 [Hymenopellis radicata]|nr:hypothetical protein BDZ89DRAFT_1085814 [Hymenopellis radicata]
MYYTWLARRGPLMSWVAMQTCLLTFVLYNNEKVRPRFLTRGQVDQLRATSGLMTH